MTRDTRSGYEGTSALGPVLWAGFYLLGGDGLGQGDKDTFLLPTPALLAGS